MPAFSIRTASDRRVCRIEIDRILPSPFQPRRRFDEGELQALAESIRRFGLLTPLLVRHAEGGLFELIAGERRLRALKLLGHSHADVLISEPHDCDCALIALIENLQREELHFLDEAEACRRILQEHPLSREELAARLSKSPSSLANLLRLLRLSRSVRSLIRENGLSERHARALLSLDDEKLQYAFAETAVREKLSVRQLEERIAIRMQAAKDRHAPTPVIRDHRLVINALKDTVRQLKRIGVPASSRVEEHDDHYDVIVTERTMQIQPDRSQ